MMWIAEVYLNNAEEHLVRVAEFVSRKKYSIDEFLADVNKKAAAVCSEDSALEGFEIVWISVEHNRDYYAI